MPVDHTARHHQNVKFQRGDNDSRRAESFSRCKATNKIRNRQIQASIYIPIYFQQADIYSINFLKTFA